QSVSLSSALFPYTTLCRSRCGGVVDVPGTADAVDLRGPDQLGLRPALVTAPDRHLLGGLEPVERVGASQDDPVVLRMGRREVVRDRKSTRLNSSHVSISYA